MIFQDPYGSLDPRLKVADIIGEALDIHQLAPTAAARRERIETLLRDVGLDVDARPVVIRTNSAAASASASASPARWRSNRS